jgi:hypothetical protein
LIQKHLIHSTLTLFSLLAVGDPTEAAGDASIKSPAGSLPGQQELEKGKQVTLVLCLI